MRLVGSHHPTTDDVQQLPSEMRLVECREEIKNTEH